MTLPPPAAMRLKITDRRDQIPVDSQCAAMKLDSAEAAAAAAG